VTAAKLLIRLVIILSVPIITAYFVYNELKSYLASPIDTSNNQSVLVEIPTDVTTEQLAELLHNAGLVRKPWVISIIATLSKNKPKILAGEYELTKNLTPKEIIKKLSLGVVVKRKVTILEGSTIEDVAQSFEDAKINTKEVFLNSLRSPELLAKANIKSSSFEGYLMPGEYEFSKTEPPANIIWKILESNEKNWTPELIAKSAELKLTRHEILTLASLIQAETTIPDLQKTISGVYHNRLMNLMKLDSKPALLYGMREKKYPEKRDYEDSKNPYNTFVHFGLPPGPINNPGKSALDAAINFKNHQYLFFIKESAEKITFIQTLNEYLVMQAKLAEQKS
jgi:UPF0755 protein